MFKSLIAALLVTSFSAQALYSTLDTGDVLGENKMEVSAETQFITDRDTGINLIARFDRGYRDDSQIRGLIGIGTTDFHIGGYYKWVPIPDYDNQPAVGLIGGIIYARHQEMNELSLRFAPIVSKKIKTEQIGEVTPYVSLPIGLRSFNEETEFPVQFELGTRYKHPNLNKVKFNAELGFNVRKAFTYVSVGLIMDFDEDYGISWE